MTLHRGLSEPCLCLVTDGNHVSGGDLSDKIASAVFGGVDMVQIRDKQSPFLQVFEFVQTLRSMIGNSASIIINGRVDLAVAIGADGVHLPENSASISNVLSADRSAFLVGRSVHNISGAISARDEGADYLILGTIFPTDSKPGVVTGGLQMIRDVTSCVDIPVFAIGGIKSSSASSVIRSGAKGIAVISAILGAQNPEVAARELKKHILQSRETNQIT